MKRKLVAFAMLLGFAFALPVWAHHAAEGIISDDIWQMVDDLLTEADSPHLNIDFDDVMNSMGVTSDPDGNLSLVTSIVVYTQDVEVYLSYIETVADEMNRFPSGKTSSGTASVFVIETELVSNQLTEISIYEPIGMGKSQFSTISKSRR